MNFPYIAQPPAPIKRHELGGHIRLVIVQLRLIIWQILVPFKPGPDDIPSLPEPWIEIDEEQMKQCEWLFDQADKRRLHLAGCGKLPPCGTFPSP